MGRSRPLISLIVPVFNRRRYLREAVTSVLREKLDPIEILVVDDGSSDGSLGTVADLPVIPLPGADNRGVSSARNRGLAAARGRWVAFLDSDDRLAPGGLRWRLDWVTRHPGAPAVGGTVAGNIDENGDPIPARHPPYQPPPWLSLESVRSAGRIVLHCGLFLFRRDWLEQIGPFDEQMRFGEDQEFLLRAIATDPIRAFPEPVFFYRLHAGNKTDQVDRKRLQATLALLHLAHGTLPLP